MKFPPPKGYKWLCYGQVLQSGDICIVFPKTKGFIITEASYDTLITAHQRGPTLGTGFIRKIK